MNKHLKYNDDDVNDIINREEELLNLRQKRIEQAAIRLAQKEQHLKIQEEKIRLLEEKRRAEAIEKRNKRLKKIFLGFLKGVGSVASVVAAIVGLLSYLRQESQYSPEAAIAYRSIIRVLEQMLSAVQHGGSLAKSVFLKVFGKITSAAKYVYNLAKDRYEKSLQLVKRDSAITKRLIKRDVSLKLKGAKFVTDSYYKPNGRIDYASNCVNRAIKIYDKKHVDIFPLAIPAAVTVFKVTLLPVLIGILKTAAISGLTAGIAGAIKEPLKENIVDPIVKRIVNNIKQVTANRQPDQTYLEAVFGKISSDMETLINILKKEKSYLASKLEPVWNRIKKLFKR